MLRRPRSRYPKSEKLFAAASRILPGGVDSPVRAFKSVGATPIFIERARGATIEDADGHTDIDYVMSWGPLLHGHAPRGLVKALAAAAARGTSFGAPTELETRLARRVAMLMPSMERVRFVSSGTEATMSAVRVARAATKRDRIVKFEGCYHGHSDAFLVQAGSGAMTHGVPTSPGVPASVAQHTLLARYNDVASVERIVEQNRGQVAAVIVEPIAGNMGVVPPRDRFLEGLRALCNREQIVLIFDEVITGFRVAPGGAQQALQVRPDLTCLGKIIGGGLPVGAYAAPAEIMDLVAPLGPVYQAGTLSGNPLAMAAGLATITYLRDHRELYGRMERAAATLVTMVAEAAAESGIALAHNRVGSMFTWFFTEGRVTDWESAARSDVAAFAGFYRAMLDAGIYLPPSQFEAAFLGAAHTDEDVRRTVESARQAFAALRQPQRASAAAPVQAGSGSPKVRS